MKILITVKTNTVGDLLDALTKLAKDSGSWDVMDASIESEAATITGFRVLERKLSDGSKVMDFELLED